MNGVPGVDGDFFDQNSLLICSSFFGTRHTAYLLSRGKNSVGWQEVPHCSGEKEGAPTQPRKQHFFLQKPPLPPRPSPRPSPCPSPNIQPLNITSVFRHVCPHPQHENMCKVPLSFGCVSEKMVTKTQRVAARQPGCKRVSDCRWEDRTRRGEVDMGGRWTWQARAPTELDCSPR